MNQHLDIRSLIRRGPSDREEAQAIVAAVMGSLPAPPPQEVEAELSSALMEMLVCRQLRSESFEARAKALAIVDCIEAAAKPASD